MVRIPRRSRCTTASGPTPRSRRTGSARGLFGLDDERIVRLTATADLHLRAGERLAQPVCRGPGLVVTHVCAGVEGDDLWLEAPALAGALEVEQAARRALERIECVGGSHDQA